MNKFIKKIIALQTVAVMVFSGTFSLQAADEADADDVVYMTTANVNFRSEPSTDSEKLALISSGTTIEVTEYDADGWSTVVYNGTEGYVSSDYIVQRTSVESGTVELLTWSEMKSIFTTGVDAEVYDIWSGQTYYVRSFSNGNHADVEPSTAADTAILKSTYGGTWSWTGRPVWVTINGHTVAAAINGMPHGSGVISGNNMDGQICLHFYGSQVHNGNTSYQNSMQAVVMQAYEASLN